ncbi:unnamed protein product [Rotaria sp. Silwood1]|nr:unnamed protein product [Rotaria sp. Silwood1]
MLSLTTIQSSTLFINQYAKSHSSENLFGSTLRLTNDSIKNNINLSTNKFQSFDNSLEYNIMKDGSTLTKTQIKVILTVVIIISFIMFIMVIFRFKNACRDQEIHNIQTEIIRQSARQYSEPSSRRGSIGYYTRKYSHTPGIRFEEHLNNSSSTKRFSVPTCNHSSKQIANAIVSSLPVESLATKTTTTTTAHHHHVTSSCKTSNHINNSYVSIAIKPFVRKSCSTIGISRVDKLPGIIRVFFSSLTILSIHCQSRRLILCTVPPHILCRPNTVRYSLVFHVHDQRQRRHTTSNRYIKVSSPALRKFCLPCITTRNHHRHSHHHHHSHHNNRQQSNRNKTLKNNQQQIITTPAAIITSESNIIESSQRFEVAPRTNHTISTTPVVHSSEYLQENDANHLHEQHQNFETSLQNIKLEKKDDEISVEAEITPTKVVSESILLTLSSPGNEITRSNEDDMCDDQTPLLTSELASNIKDSTDRNTRKYSLNALLPLARSPNSHPLSSSSTVTTAIDSQNAGDDNKNRNHFDLKSRRRISLSSALRRSSFAKQSQTVNSIIDSTNQNQLTISPSHISLPTSNNNNNNNHYQSSTADSDSSDRTSLLKAKTLISKNQLKKKSSSITPIKSSSISSYRKDFMQKIERFRFIDDSASSTTTVTSPVESIDRMNGHRPCSHLITSAIEQFDDYVRSKYDNNDDINSYIDRLDSDMLKNGTYSDLNILSSTNNNISKQKLQTIQQQHTVFKPVKNISSELETGDYRQTIRNSSAPITIPSQHTKHNYPSDNSIARPTTIITNGHSRSMDFQSINNNNRHELIRPITLTNPGTIYEASSSSIATLTSVRSSNSLEFDDDTKPSGVLVDDDFLPMSSPVDDHFWDMTIPKHHHKFNNNNNNKKECFPNVGSSPDIEIKHFDVQQINKLSSSIDQALSETSCDEDDDNNNNTLLNQQKFSIHEYKLKELQKPIVVHRSLFNPSIHSTEQISHNNDLISLPIKKLSLDHTNDESLLEKFASANNESIQIPIRSPPFRTSTTNDVILSTQQQQQQQQQQHPQTIYEEDDTQESSTNDNVSDESADNGEIDLVHEFELSQKQELTNNNNLWSTNDRNIFILQEDDLLSALVTTQTQSQPINRPLPPSIMKITNNKSFDSIDEQQTTATTTMASLKPKVRFNLDPQYEREREWNKVNKLLGNSVEWTDEFEV